MSNDMIRLPLRINCILAVTIMLGLLLPVAAQDDSSDLDATYCVDGLRFNYPAVWDEPERANIDEFSSLLAEVTLTNSPPLDDLPDYYIGIQVSEDHEFRKLFRDSDEHGLPLMNELMQRYFETFASSTLEDLIIDYDGEMLFKLHVWASTGELTIMLFDTGILITAGTVQSSDYFDWADTAAEIIDSVRYTPDTPCSV